MDAIPVERSAVTAAKRDRDMWCAHGPIQRMQAQLAERGVTATSLADVPMLRVPDLSGGTWDLACVPHRHHDDQLWWAWLRHGRDAGAPAELEYICPSGDPHAAERIVRAMRGAEVGRR